MNDLHAALRTPKPFTAANGKSYLLRFPSIGAMNTLGEWVALRPFRRIQGQLSGLSPDVQAKLYDSAIVRGEAALEKLRRGEGSTAVMDLFSTLDGLQQLFKAMAHEDHGLIGDDEAAAAVTEATAPAAAALFGAVFGTNSPDPTAGSSTVPQPPTSQNAH